MNAGGPSFAFPVCFPPGGRTLTTGRPLASLLDLLRRLFSRGGRMGPGISGNVGIDVGLDPKPAGVVPQFVQCSMIAYYGSGGAAVSSSQWTPTGKIRYKARNTSGGADSKVTSYKPTSAGTAYAPAISLLGLEPGQSYVLQFWLDCIPDVEGYTEQWRDTTIAWTQPLEEPDLEFWGTQA